MKASAVKAVFMLAGILLVVSACFYYDWWLFKKLHPEAGVWLWILNALH